MPKPTIAQEILILMKGAIGSAIAYGAIALLNYIGTHIPDLYQFTCSIAASWGVIRFNA